MMVYLSMIKRPAACWLDRVSMKNDPLNFLYERNPETGNYVIEISYTYGDVLTSGTMPAIVSENGPGTSLFLRR